MQTHEWEALLDGTTPGPWKVYNEDSIMILDADDTSVLDLDERYLTHKLSDVRLAAAAPAAVAEVVRQAARIGQLNTELRAQSAQIERVREALHRIEQADEQAQHDWDANYNPDSQSEALAYSMAAQWLEEALGDTDE